MKDSAQPGCPRTEQLSAWIDGELPPAARSEIAAHAETCALCGAMLTDLNELRAALRPLAGARLDIDLAPAIGERIAGRPPERPARAGVRPARASSWWSGWQVVPSGLAAAGTLAAGLYLGMLLTAGGGVAALSPAAMAVFDPVPPGGLCVGLTSCYPLEK